MTTSRRHRAIAYDVGGSGPFVVLIHGYPLDRTAVADVAARLQSRATVVNVDLRGFGHSDPVLDGDLSMERHADDVAAVLDAEGIPEVTVAGLSMGGYVALALADRRTSLVSRLALIGSKTQPDDDAQRAARDAQADRILAEGRGAIVEASRGLLLGPAAPPHLHARLRTMIEATPYETYLAALAGMRDRADHGDTLASFAGPTAIIVGEQDPIVPVALASSTADAVGAALTVVPGAGHLVTMEAPEAVAGALAQLLEA